MRFCKDEWQKNSWQKNSWQKNSWTVWLCLILFVKAVVLVGAFSVLHPGLQADAAEILYWTHELQWSGQKHPAMPSWILKALLFFLPDALPSYYLVGQITLLATYLFVWRLAQEFLPPLSAMLATLVLACGLFYSFYSLTYNANTVSLLAWAAFNFFLWKALNDGRTRWWMALAVAAAVALLTKYAVVLLFLAAAATILIRPRWRQYLKTYKPYAMAALVGTLTMPHWWWVLHNDYATFAYATAQISQQVIQKSTAPFLPALYFPLRFTYGQIVNMLPVLLCFAVFVPWREKPQKVSPSSSPSLSDEQLGSSLDKKAFLLTMGLLPFAISIALSALRQQYIHSLWGLFYWNLTGVMLFYFCRNAISARTIRRRLPIFFALWGGLVLLSTVGVLTLPFVASPRQAWLFDGPYQVETKLVAQKRSAIDALLGRSEWQSRAQQEQDQENQAQENQAEEELDEESRALPRVAMPPSLRPFFDGRLLASKVAEGWSNEGYPPLSVVGGGWLATNVSFFATSKPAVVTLFDGERTAWLSHKREQWREQGGVLLWFARHQDEGLPLRYRQALRGRPYALQQPFVVAWRRIFGVEVSRVRGVAAPLIGWVFVPPLRQGG